MMLSFYQISDETTETLAEYTYKKQLELMSNVHVYGVGGGVSGLSLWKK